MRKLLLRLALALLPVALYLAVFIAFEPNNYFGLRKSGGGNSPIAKLRAYEAAPQNAVILGDSRMAHFDMALVAKSAGRPFANVAYGGASLEESIDAVYYLYKQNPQLDAVVLGLSFYTLNAAYRPANRMKTVETQLKNPAAYVFNLEYNLNTLTILADTVRGRAGVEAKETAEHTEIEYVDETGAALPVRNNLIDYAATLYANCAAKGTALLPARAYQPSAAKANNGNATGAMAPATAQLANPREVLHAMQTATPADSKFALNEDAFAELEKMAAFCAEKGVALTLVLPPMHASVRDLVCVPLGIDKAMQPALQRLAKTGARVLDYEWANPPAYTDAQYYDGFHLDERYGLPMWTETLFSSL